MSSGDPNLDFSGQPAGSGQTSAESRAAVPSQDARVRLRQGLSAGLSLYEFLLLASCIFVALACLQMYFNVNRVDPEHATDFPFSNPYKTEEARIGGV